MNPNTHPRQLSGVMVKRIVRPPDLRARKGLPPDARLKLRVKPKVAEGRERSNKWMSTPTSIPVMSAAKDKKRRVNLPRKGLPTVQGEATISAGGYAGLGGYGGAGYGGQYVGGGGYVPGGYSSGRGAGGYAGSARGGVAGPYGTTNRYGGIATNAGYQLMPATVPVMGASKGKKRRVRLPRLGLPSMQGEAVAECLELLRASLEE